MKKCPKCGLINPDSALRCDCGWDFQAQNMQEACLSPPLIEQQGYEILPNGKKRYLRATGGDVFFCVLLPFWGLVIGGIAFVRGEKKRGQTMMLIGCVGLLIFAIGTAFFAPIR